MLTAVGLGSVPTWLKPYRVLSDGRAVPGRPGAGDCSIADFGSECGFEEERRSLAG